MSIRRQSTLSGGSTARNTTLSGNTMPRARFSLQPQSETVEFSLEAFLARFKGGLFLQYEAEEKQRYLESFDALEMFIGLQDINRELAVVKLENHFLMEFLEKNDPKLLIGLKQQRATALSQKVMRTTMNTPLDSSKTSSGYNLKASISKRSISQSVYTTGSTKKIGGIEYRLNYRAKIDMAEKAASDVEKRIHDLEVQGMRSIKLLNARVEELRYLSDETEETSNNFQLHFLRDQRDVRFLETATEKQMERKFRKFMNNWIKCARALLGTMRLRITALQENCQQLRTELITKADLSGILGAVDFEQLTIVRTELLQSLEDKNAHMAGLKGLAGKAALAMAEEKRIMMTTEAESKRTTHKTIEVIKAISKLEKEANYVEECNTKDLKILKSLKEQCDRFEAPSVNQYIEKKDELHVYEKEEKMLQRKISILSMKLNNLLKKCKRRSTIMYPVAS